MAGDWRLECRTTVGDRPRCREQAPWARGLRVTVLGMGLALAGCHLSRMSSTPPEINVSRDSLLHPIAAGVWIHTTFLDLPGMGRVPANGLVIIDGKEAMLVDLPWTDDLTAALGNWIADRRGAALKIVIPTHFHEDCMGGLAEAHRRGAVSYGLDRTVEIARHQGLPVPRISYHDRITIRCGATSVVMTYLGAGHTADNVVAWLPRQRILFAGCLVKSLDSTSLGNTQDGDLAAYPATLRRLQATYPQAKIVVPGHGAWGGPELIEHTWRLCQEKAPKSGEQ
jgi:metallo-beta-lactamase class B